MHDPARRRKASRQARQKGCSVYIPAEILQEAGIDLSGPPPRYRVWAGRRGSLLITLYPETGLLE